jgi:predicted HicB family RNase H-like nuclease
MLLAQIEARLRDYAAKLKADNLGNDTSKNNDVVMLGVPLPKELHEKMRIAAKENNTSLKKLAVHALSIAFKG